MNFESLHEYSEGTQKWILDLCESIQSDAKPILESGKGYDGCDASMSDEVEANWSGLVSSLVEEIQVPQTKEDYEYENGDLILNDKVA